jgi:hypothetical protein
MKLYVFGTLLVGESFCLPSTLAGQAFEEHILRKIGALHAEYVDGSGTVLIPEGTVVWKPQPRSTELPR